jgi:hypothetical protein
MAAVQCRAPRPSETCPVWGGVERLMLAGAAAARLGGLGSGTVTWEYRLTSSRRVVNAVIRRLAPLGLAGRHTYVRHAVFRLTGAPETER